jgi:bifunctional DNase/RNase
VHTRGERVEIDWNRVDGVLMEDVMKPAARSLLLSTLAGAMFSLAPICAFAETDPDAGSESMVRVQRVEVISSPVGPVVVLRIRNKAIPVFVESLVAHSIQGALAGNAPARPLSHDLMHTILESLDAKVTQAVITLKDGTYYGALTITVGGKPKVFDSRSSDAIALAIRFKAPILLDRSLVESVGVEQPEPRGNPI